MKDDSNRYKIFRYVLLDIIDKKDIFFQARNLPRRQLFRPTREKLVYF
jgi:hypothetical protein